MNFRVGDTVQLKSGGPDMKILEIDDRDQVVTSWPDDNGVVQKAEFPAASLWRVSPVIDEQPEQPRNYTFNFTVPSNEMRAQLTVTHYLALICFCDLLFRSSLNSLAQQVLGMVIGTLLVWCAEKLWKRYAT